MGVVKSAAKRRARWAVTLAAVGLIGASGCGGGKQVDSAAPAGRVAQFVPANTPVYLEMSIDLASPQWQMAQEIARRFPGYDKLIAEAQKSMTKDGVDFQRDVRPLLGDDAALGVPDLSGDNNPKYVFAIDLADGKDEAARALMLKDPSTTAVGQHAGVTLYKQKDGGGDAFTAIFDNAIVLADSRETLIAAIDAHAAGDSKTMAGSARLRDALGTLPDEVLAQGFVDVGQLVLSLQGKRGASVNLTKQLDALGWSKDSFVALSVAAEEDGIRLKAVGHGLGQAHDMPSFTPTLLQHASVDAIGAIDLGNTFESFRISMEAAGAADPKVKDQLATVRGAMALIGLSVDDLKLLFSREQVVVVEPKGQVPAIVGAMAVDDGAKAGQILDRLRTQALAFLGERAKIPPFTQVQLASGVSGWESKVSPKASIVYGVDGDLVIVGSDVEAVKRFQNPGSRLTDDPAYQSATDQMPDKVQSVLWVNVGKLLDLVQANGGFDKPGDAVALANLRPIRNLAGWSTGGERPTFEVFATVK